MSGDVLDELRSRVERLGREPTAANAQDASGAVRSAWAEIYDALLTAGAYPPDRLDAFARLLDVCADAMSKVRPDRYTVRHLQRLGFYRQLLHTAQTRGVAAVDSDLGRALASLRHTGDFQ